VAEEVDFVPLTYSSAVYLPVEPRAKCHNRARLCRQQFALLALPTWLSALALAWPPALSQHVWSRGPNTSSHLSHAQRLWIQAIVAFGPPLGGPDLHGPI